MNCAGRKAWHLPNVTVSREENHGSNHGQGHFHRTYGEQRGLILAVPGPEKGSHSERVPKPVPMHDDPTMPLDSRQESVELLIRETWERKWKPTTKKKQL